MANIPDTDYEVFATELIKKYCTIHRKYLNVAPMVQEIVKRLKEMVAKDSAEEDYDETDFYYDRHNIWHEVLNAVDLNPNNRDDDREFAPEGDIRTFLEEHGVDFEKYD